MTMPDFSVEDSAGSMHKGRDRLVKSSPGIPRPVLRAALDLRSKPMPISGAIVFSETISPIVWNCSRAMRCDLETE
jgi:hypothetical protein